MSTVCVRDVSRSLGPHPPDHTPRGHGSMHGPRAQDRRDQIQPLMLGVPLTKAGPRDRAGFMDAPVRGPPISTEGHGPSDGNRSELPRGTRIRRTDDHEHQEEGEQNLSENARGTSQRVRSLQPQPRRRSVPARRGSPPWPQPPAPSRRQAPHARARCREVQTPGSQRG